MPEIQMKNNEISLLVARSPRRHGTSLAHGAIFPSQVRVNKQEESSEDDGASRRVAF